MQQFRNKHIEHRRNIIAKRHRDFHGCEDLAIIAPGQSLRDYNKVHGTMKQVIKQVERVSEHDYQLTGASACTSAMEGVRKLSPTEALQQEIGTDGLTRQERGMIDRELFPKRKHANARKKYVRTVRQRSNTIVCDLITDDGKTLVLPMTAALQHHELGEHMPRGRQRVHRLPESIADKLTELTLTTDIRRTILGAIPPSKRATLQRRAIKRAAGLGPAAVRIQETLSPGCQEPGDRRKANRKRGPQGPPGHTEGAGEGRAESDGGRGSRVPRRGFSK